MGRDILHTNTLQCRLKAALRKIKEFESGERYTRMEREHERRLAAKDREERKLRKELADAHKECVTVRKYWSEVMDDLYREFRKKEAAWARQLKGMEERALRAERRVDECLGQITEMRRKMYGLESRLEESGEREALLRSQMAKDHENSSKPSSDRPLHKKIPNSREKTGRKPGAQPGHVFHARKRLPPTQPAEILPPPECFTEDADFYPTGRYVKKQKVDIRVSVTVRELWAEVYRCRSTGSRFHAPFPEGFGNDVNYGEGIKAFAFLLNNYCNVSTVKTGELISGLTDGKACLSAGMINSLSKKFSGLTEDEREGIFARLVNAPVLYTDNTVGRVNGKGKSVTVCTDGEDVLYFFKEKKGHEGVKGTPVECFRGTLVHDHDSTFYRYGTSHQECLAHVLRYLKGVMENEPSRTWAAEMRGLLRKMIHEAKHAEGALPEEKCAAFEKEYGAVLEKAAEEYEYEPPGKYCRDGYCLQKRLREGKEHYLYFLRHPEVGYTNNVSERCCRKYKRKQKQAVTFRSEKNAQYLCDALSVIETRKNRGENIYRAVREIFA